MEQLFKRAENIDEKLKNISLPYFEWKVLFLVSEETSVADLQEILKNDAREIEIALKSLLKHGLVEYKENGHLKEPVGEFEEKLKKESAEDHVITAKTETVEDLPEVYPEKAKETEFELDKQPLFPEEPEHIPEKLEDFFEEKKDLQEIMEEASVAEKETKNGDSDELSGLLEEFESIGAEAPEITKAAVTEIVEEPVAPPETEIISDVSKKTIMVIDDSIVIRKMVEIALEEEEYRILTSISGKDGLSMLDRENPNLVILDMMLPDMNGIDVLKAIKAAKGTPVIMLSGKDSPQLIETAKSMGADDFLPKPFRDEDLVAKIKNLLE